ncbi:MAG: xanthine dehydrogenase family protein molybdopterin-binding subunit [Candidatus Palauibacterales bacterium]|nr:xanthine dehydrogenase family protein molybdopterin-binding subunit [Candidatus Palauibacterales bacterium]MDP2530049.1 xanthine dehydrogenase family protein molybdopterin-binding subunit [Candidatus Palauibacterales bacterium]MDP2582823.1 xanthine dehydrogenase family protein molybdopterin-binding subunit [Candidatus Palauibacterales bacterium]
MGAWTKDGIEGVWAALGSGAAVDASVTASGGLNRRQFVKVAGVAGAGLVLAVSLPGCSPKDRSGAGGTTEQAAFAPNAWIRVGTDGRVTFMVDRSEMGQGVTTALPMMLAEELEVPLDDVHFEFAPAAKEYFNPMFGMQGTGGSTSVRAAWEPLRKAGAAARIMLISAAARKWGVDPSTCTAADGKVTDGSGHSASYGELAEAAATETLPENPPLKDRKDFKILGKPHPRLDTPFKTDGSATFGIDVRPEGVLIGSVERSPVYGGKVRSLDDSKAMQVPGVRKVVNLGDRVGVVADHYWAAQKGREALDVEWDDGKWADQSSEKILATFRELGSKPGAVARDDGDAGTALQKAGSRVHEATFDLPYLAHACMEPMNATAHVRPDGCEVWVPTQFQTANQQTAAKLAGVDPSKVQVHTTYLGGGFGRRAMQDFVEDAVLLSKAAGAPVKAVWSREDDVRHDGFRPASHHVLRAALDGSGKPVAWSHRVVAPSITRVFSGQPLENGLDTEAVEGAVAMPYAIPNVHVDYHDAEVGVPVWFWRSVNNSFNGMVVEGMIDELAHLAGKDPYQYRHDLLADKPIHRRVLDLAADKAGWGKALASGRARGIAVFESFNSHVAQVAEVSIQGGKPRVHRVVAAVDCGPTVNPSIIEAQIQSAIVYGLTAALYGNITIRNGRCQQGNFDDYLMLRIDEMPEVEVHVVMDSDADQGGIGEPGTPPIAPAVCNALRSLTGKPIRSLPISV